MNTLKWLIKREFWENRGGFFWAPVIAGIVFLVLNVGGILVALAAAGRAHVQIGLVKLDTVVKNLDPAAREIAGAGIDMTLYMVAGFLGIVVGFVVFFYCLGALYDERRDRSVLFWKSLPLSDASTVLSKVLSAAIVAPVIGAVAGILTGIGVLLIIAIFFAFHGQNVLGLLFLSGSPLKVAGTLLAAIPVGALWALPAVGWLMLCSAWAKSKPFLWAVFIPVGVGIMVSWFDLMQSIDLSDFWFWENVVFRVLFSVFPFSWLGKDYFDKMEALGNVDARDMVTNLFGLSDVVAPLAQPEIWIGAVVGIAMIFLAIRLRRWRDDG